MRPSDAFGNLEPAKERFARAVLRALTPIQEVTAITFTGSFVEKPGLAGISDIDIIVIVDPLTQTTFEACKLAVAAVPASELGLQDHQVVINDTFGPLKFDQPGQIVIHLMVYDRAGHRDHVLQSPFTCLDWERSPYQSGQALRTIHPCLSLQPRQFLEARRSLANYLEDLSSGTISYRQYQFTGTNRIEIRKQHPLDQRHQGEFAYHVVRNLVVNYAKLLAGENRTLSEAELLDFWCRRLPGCGGLIDWFAALREIKQARQREFPADTLARTREFLAAFAAELEHTWLKDTTRHLFVRHAQTGLNDGSFLGQRRDPPILTPPAPLSAAPRRAIASPALRARQTAQALAPEAELRTERRLQEIDYGQAEALTFPELADKFPALVAAWNRGEDPAFPDGENTAAVHARLRSVLDDLPEEPTLLVTHNVVLRCLLGSGLSLPPACWHRLPVPHLESIEVLRLQGRYYLNLTPAQIMLISDALAGHLT